jgi:hypothetical protein
MAKTVPVIGVEPSELRWLRLLVFLLRHPDPVVPELVRQALLHVEDVASAPTAFQLNALDHVG